MERHKVKILVLLLLLIGTVLLPRFVTADEAAAVIGNTTYPTVSAAIAAAGNGATVVLRKDCVNQGVTVAKSGQSLQIDLNGYTVSESRSNYNGILVESGNVTIRNGVVRNTAAMDDRAVGGIYVAKGAKASLIDLTVTSDSDCALYAMGGVIEVNSGVYTGYDDVVYCGSAGAVSLYNGNFRIKEGSDSWFEDGAFFSEPGCADIVHQNAHVLPADWRESRAADITVLYFKDIPAVCWYRSFVYGLALDSILNGKGNGVFAPADSVKRGEFAKILAAASGDDVSAYRGQSVFRDVDANAWYNPFVNWAAKNGIVLGYGNGDFNPNGQIKRQEIAVMLSRYLDYLENTDLPADHGPVAFTDKNKIAPWAAEAVMLMAQAGVINGYTDKTFRPTQSATRAETAKMTYVFLDALQSE